MAKAKVKLELKSKSDAELVQFSQQHITKMTGNADFPTPDPDAATFLAGKTAFETALSDAEEAQQTAKEKTATKDNARLAVEGLLTDRGSYVERKSGGDKAKILGAGFDVKGERTPTGVPPMVSNLSLTAGDNAGEVDAQWDSLTGSKITYETQTSPEPMTPTSWTNQPRSTKSKLAITGLVTGSRVWVRVRATSPGGEGAWSDPATKIVP